MDLIIMDAGDIKGECTVKGYEDKIEVLSFNHAISMAVTTDISNQARTEGKPNHSDVTISKYVDLSTCSLIDYCDQAKAIKTVKIIMGQNQQGKMNEVLCYTLTDVIISSDSIGAGAGPGKATETVSLNYGTITWTYKPQQASADASGQTSAKWSLITNTAS